MQMTSKALLAFALAGSLAACSNSPSVDRQLGYEVDEGGFGQVTRNNTGIMSGEINVTQVLANRFAAEVPGTITFPFNSAELTPEARQILAQQASWISQFPELRFSVYGHADAVGSNAFNQRLGQRRAQAVVNFFAAQGISRNRLEALVSFGETRPVVASQGPEEANRRTVTTVSGFHGKRRGTLLDSRYAAIVYREYVEGGTRPHPANTNITTQVDPGQK
jgi:outer membrane protein OmpA-like peptidoglycan-associated protein